MGAPLPGEGAEYSRTGPVPKICPPEVFNCSLLIQSASLKLNVHRTIISGSSSWQLIMSRQPSYHQHMGIHNIPVGVLRLFKHNNEDLYIFSGNLPKLRVRNMSGE